MAIIGDCMKKENKNKNLKQGFTLLELLVVVLIIGILAAIALPQYKMAVTKAKVASILPLMRRWKDALQEYKLQHGSYEDLNMATAGATLGVNWPNDWNNGQCEDVASCSNDYWQECIADEDSGGEIKCRHSTNDGEFIIFMYQPDDPNYEELRGKITCYATGDEAHKICKALGGKLSEEVEDEYILY